MEESSVPPVVDELGCCCSLVACSVEEWTGEVGGGGSLGELGAGLSLGVSQACLGVLGGDLVKYQNYIDTAGVVP